MNYKQSTQVPNIVFDKFLPEFSLAELKLLLIIIRQTQGWVNKKSGKRKTRDRISHSQFIKKTGLSRRVISKTIQSLVDKGLIVVSDYRGNILYTAQKRKGRGYLYYSFLCFQPVHSTARTWVHSVSEPVHQSAYNKTNYTKLNETKRNTLKTVGEIIETIKQEIRKTHLN